MTDPIDSQDPHPTSHAPRIPGRPAAPAVPAESTGTGNDGGEGALDVADVADGVDVVGSLDALDVRTLVAVARDSSLPVIITRLEGLLDDLRAGESARSCLAELAPADLITAFATAPKPGCTGLGTPRGHGGARASDDPDTDDMPHRRAS